MITIQQLDLDKTKRMIVISDIHANVDLFKALLKKIDYTEDDYLFLNGDLCEKGPGSLETVAYVRDLTKKFDRVYVTKGNCDVVFRYVFDGKDGIIPYMERQKYSILNEMLFFHNKSIKDFSNLKELSQFYQEHYSEEINWLESLPVAYETDEHIIIHAGIDNVRDWQLTEETFALYAQSFYEKEHQADKTVIVGHWPVVNYRTNDTSSHNPIIDLDKRIIALDGGNQIKRDGQLNALLIENESYSYTYADELEREVCISKGHHETLGRVGTVTYPNYEMDIIEEGLFFTLCENRNLGIQHWIKNEYLTLQDDRVISRDVSTTFLSVNQLEKVFLIDDGSAGYSLIKKENGEIGWIPKSCFERDCSVK